MAINQKDIKMRKMLLISMIILATHSYSSAQEKDIKKIYTDITTKINSALLTQKSSIEMSGFISYSYYKTRFDYGDKREQHLVQIEPIISYFFSENLSFGLNFSYRYEKTENEVGNDPGAIEQLFIGPIGKYYFAEGAFRPFLFTDYLFLTGDNFDGGELGFGAGIMYHMVGNVGLNLQIKYGQIWSNKNNIDSQNTIFIGIGLSNFIF
jgi:hypothetical protein